MSDPASVCGVITNGARSLDCRAIPKTNISTQPDATVRAEYYALGLGTAHALACDAVAKALGTNLDFGLSADGSVSETDDRRAQRAWQRRPAISAWRRFLAQFQSPLVLLLIVAISRFRSASGESSAKPPSLMRQLTILIIVVANAALGYFQESRAEAAIASLREMTPAQASLLRDGVCVVVPVAEIVPGDVLLVEEGATVPADARVVHSASLCSMEAPLTGESEAVSKDVEPVPADAVTADRSNMLFAGTTVSFGHGRAIVTATGMNAEIGRIADLLARTVDEQTPLQRELDRTGRVLGLVVIAIALDRRCNAAADAARFFTNRADYRAAVHDRARGGCGPGRPVCDHYRSAIAGHAADGASAM